MDKLELKKFIRANTPNVHVDDQSIEIIVHQFEEQTLQKDDYLLRQGKVSNYYFISSGFLRVFTFDTQGKEVTIYFYAQGRVVFDAASFFQKLPSAENIQAMTECKVYVTNFDKLNGLFHSVPAFREFGRQMLVKEFVAFKKRTLALINQTPEERYLSLMETTRDVFQFAHLSHIASYLGVSERTLNRIRQNFLRR